MAATDIFLAIALVCWCLSNLALLYLYRRFTKQRGVLAAVSRDLDRALCCLNGAALPEGGLDFAASLEEAAIKTKLQDYTAARHANRAEPGTVPEKYRHVSILVNHGLDKEAISAILQIPRDETEQLLTLSHLTEQCA
jgi:hypothetical protein